MADKKIRVVGWQVQLMAMADDGETLEALNVKPVQIPIKAWEDFKNGGDAQAIATVQEQLGSA